MKKQTAIDMFGSVARLASALGITRQAIYQWQEDLPQDQIDRITGAALRLGLSKVSPGETPQPAQVDG